MIRNGWIESLSVPSFTPKWRSPLPGNSFVNACFSPDGAKLAISLGKAANSTTAVFVLDSVTGNPLPESPQVNPAGKVFFSGRNDEIVVRSSEKSLNGNEEVFKLFDKRGALVKTKPAFYDHVKYDEDQRRAIHTKLTYDKTAFQPDPSGNWLIGPYPIKGNTLLAILDASTLRFLRDFTLVKGSSLNLKIEPTTDRTLMVAWDSRHLLVKRLASTSKLKELEALPSTRSKAEMLKLQKEKNLEREAALRKAGLSPLHPDY